MHIKFSASIILITATLLVASPLFAQREHHSGIPTGQSDKNNGQLIRITEKDAAWAAKERANYRLDVCVSSDEKLGSMGKAPEYIYRAAGKDDRLVVFCCAGCEEDFLKDPLKHLAKIDAAKARSKGSAKQKGNTEAKDAHKGHR